MKFLVEVSGALASDADAREADARDAEAELAKAKSYADRLAELQQRGARQEEAQALNRTVAYERKVYAAAVAVHDRRCAERLGKKVCDAVPARSC